MRQTKRCLTWAAVMTVSLTVPMLGVVKGDKRQDNAVPAVGETIKTESAAVPTAQVPNDPGSRSAEVAVSVPADAAATRAGEQINWQVIASGGGLAASTNFLLDGTVGQTVVGAAESPSFRLNQGYWQNFVSVEYCCQGTTGNVNGDPGGNVDLSDLIFFVNYLFLGGGAPACSASANVNGDAGCSVDLSDLIYLVNFLFLGGPSPAVCLPECE
ncbi:hypothetical protein KQH82_03005 [bacterium]|nr:hypothetical protein [bacterium]